MTMRCSRAVFAGVFALGMGMAGLAQADTTITTFDNFNLGGTYAAWANAGLTTITSNPTNYQVESVGFGGGFHDVNPSANGSGENTIEFDVTVNSGDTPNVLAILEDGDGTQIGYRWFVLPGGNHVLSQPLTPVPNSGFNGISYDNFPAAPGGTAGFNFASIPFFHIQVDAHGSNVPYDISFNNLRLTNVVVPEPTTLALLAVCIGGVIATMRRRRLMD